MSVYNNYDPEQANKAAMIFFAFMLILCLIMVGANLFAGAAIAWGWVFAPVWGSLVLGFLLNFLGIKPPGQ